MSDIPTDIQALVGLLNRHKLTEGAGCSCGQTFGGYENRRLEWHTEHVATALVGQVMNDRSVSFVSTEDIKTALRQAFQDTNPWDNGSEFDWAAEYGLPEYIWERAACNLQDVGFTLTATEKATALRHALNLQEAIEYLDSLSAITAPLANPVGETK